MKNASTAEHKAESFVVTASFGGKSLCRVWDSNFPFALGRPFRWVLEHTSSGIRVRDLGEQPGQLSKKALPEISIVQLQNSAKSGSPIEIKSLPEVRNGDVSIQIRPVRTVGPAFEQQAVAGEKTELHSFRCIGDWITQSDPVGSSFTGRNPKVCFTIRKKGGSYSISFKTQKDSQKNPKGGSFIQEGGSRAQPAPETLEVNAEQLEKLKIYSGIYCWRFASIQPQNVVSKNTKGKAAAAKDFETVTFERSIIATSAILSLFLIMTWMWPKPDPQKEELIPAQYTQIVMTPAKEQAPSEPTKSPAQQAASSAPKTVQNTAVVRALRAEALQNSISGLLKGGMTSLLVQSDLVSGNRANQQAKALFDSKSEALKVTSPTTGINEAKNAKVASVGGSAVKDGVGYGKGGDTKVQGQGMAHVTLDIQDAVVDEGLSRDEVGAVIHQHLAEIRYCYESAMLKAPNIEGKLNVAFTISGSGVVKSAAVKSSTVPDPRLDDCVIRRLMTWKFPTPKGRIEVSVNYPFIFKTLGR